MLKDQALPSHQNRRIAAIFDVLLQSGRGASASNISTCFPQGGGGYSNFSAYVGSGPASTIHTKKYQVFQAPQKIFEFLATQKNIPHSVP